MEKLTFLEVVVYDRDSRSDVLHVPSCYDVLLLDHHELVLSLILEELVIAPPPSAVQGYAGCAAVTQHSHRMPLAVAHLHVRQPKLMLVRRTQMVEVEAQAKLLVANLGKRKTTDSVRTHANKCFSININRKCRIRLMFKI